MRRLWKPYFFVIAIVVLSSGCNVVSGTDVSKPTLTSTFSSTIHQAANIETPHPKKQTPTPTSTPYKSLTKLPLSVSPVSSEHSPTLSASDAGDTLEALLQTNGGCDLPCFLGLTPGKSTISETKQLFYPLSKLSTFTFWDNRNGQVLLKYPVDNQLFSLGIYVSSSSSNFLELINVQAGVIEPIDNDSAIDIFGAPFFKEIMRPYTVSNILNKQGPPSRVFMGAYSNCGGGEQTAPCNPISVVLLYPNTGVLVEYLMPFELHGNEIEACFSKANIQMWLILPSEGGMSYMDIYERTGLWMYFTPEFQSSELLDTPSQKDIEVATSMSIEEFTQMFTATNKDCLTSPLEIWGTP